MANPSRTLHPPVALLAGGLLFVGFACLGAWLAFMYDVVRIGVLDPGLASAFGYSGEHTPRSSDPLLQGISYDAYGVLFFVGLVVALAAFPMAVLARRTSGDPAAIPFALALGCVASAAGFGWVALDASEAAPGDWGLLEQVIRFGVLWVPLVMLAIAAACALLWWRRGEAVTSDAEGVNVPA